MKRYRMVLCVIVACGSALPSILAQADDRYVTGFYADTLYGYAENDPYEMELERANPEVELESYDVELAGETVQAYFAVIGEDADEGLWLVESGDGRYWVEKVAVIVEPSVHAEAASNEDCDKDYAAIGGKAEVTDIAGTVGLGKKCKPD